MLITGWTILDGSGQRMGVYRLATSNPPWGGNSVGMSLNRKSSC